jgi:hypothetical protein
MYNAAYCPSMPIFAVRHSYSVISKKLQSAVDNLCQEMETPFMKTPQCTSCVCGRNCRRFSITVALFAFTVSGWYKQHSVPTVLVTSTVTFHWKGWSLIQNTYLMYVWGWISFYKMGEVCRKDSSGSRHGLLAGICWIYWWHIFVIVLSCRATGSFFIELVT